MTMPMLKCPEGCKCEVCREEREEVTMRNDAARYRWLRDNGHIKFLCRGDEVDKLVDAEMAKPPLHLEI